MTLAKYVTEHTQRGACTCGKCVEIDKHGGLHENVNPEGRQPTDAHTVDLTFFKLATRNAPTKDELEELVRDEMPEILDGKEHGYMEIGGKIGDQGVALQLIGLGQLVGLWTVMSPDTMMPYLPKQLKLNMAGHGMVSMQYKDTKVEVN